MPLMSKGRHLVCPGAFRGPVSGFARFVAFALSVSLGACGGDAGSGGDSAATQQVERYTVADTVVVRTVAGSAWGADATLVPEVEIGVLDGDPAYMFGRIRSVAVGGDGRIYAVDAQVPELRVFGPDGSHLGTWGRAGGGPGEFGQPDGGLAVLTDGRVVVRDPGNARLQVFSRGGEALETWPVIAGGFTMSSPMIRQLGDTLLTPVVMDFTMDVSEWRQALQRISPEGEVVDTLPVPDTGYETAVLEARVENSVSINSLPYATGEIWAFHPEGFFVHGISDEYSFTLLDPVAPIRVEREVELPLVTAGEKAEERAQTTRDLRYTDPNWRWDGPPIPDRKPAFDQLYVGTDGRIWAYRPGPGVEVEDPGYDPSDPDSVEDRWKDTRLFDVFGRDGVFQGTVEAPLDMSLYPTPVFGTDHVWAVARDDFDVQRIVRYRIQVGAGG